MRSCSIKVGKETCPFKTSTLQVVQMPSPPQEYPMGILNFLKALAKVAVASI